MVPLETGKLGVHTEVSPGGALPGRHVPSDLPKPSPGPSLVCPACQPLRDT